MTGLLDVTSWDWSGWLENVRASGAGGWLLLSVGMIFVTIVIQMSWPVGSNTLVALVWRAPPALRFAFVVTCLYCATLAAPEKAPPFIYFQF